MFVNSFVIFCNIKILKKITFYFIMELGQLIDPMNLLSSKVPVAIH